MQFMLLIHIDERAMPTVPTDKTYELNAAYGAYNAALQKAGAMVCGDRLKPSELTTVVKVRDDKTEVLDGPFIETKEQLGGYYIIEAADLDSAIAWAAKCPAASTSTIEVRPIWKAAAA